MTGSEMKLSQQKAALCRDRVYSVITFDSIRWSDLVDPAARKNS